MVSSKGILQKWFPETTTPFIANAPMFPAANAKLAAAVVKAGGFGIIAGGTGFTEGTSTIPALSKQLSEARTLLNLDSSSLLPVAIGFLTLKPANFIPAVEPLLLEHKPAGVWLFCPATPQDHSEIIPQLKKIGEPWGLKVFVQVGSVQAAREAASDGADVIVAQGIDAGGHQWAQGAGVLTIVPEVRDMLDAAFGDQTIALLAAGGVSDGRGVAASLALGADGAVMGTRFLVTAESPSTVVVKDAILAASDGGSSTIKSTVHDDIQGTAFWPALYDGRAVVGESWKDHVKGLSVEENVKKHRDAAEKGDGSRVIVWAGTGVGLVREAGGAGELVRKTQEQVRKVIRGLGSV